MGDIRGEVKTELVDYLARVTWENNYPVHPGPAFFCFFDALETIGINYDFVRKDIVHFSMKPDSKGRIASRDTYRRTRSILPYPDHHHIHKLTRDGFTQSMVRILDDMMGKFEGKDLTSKPYQDYLGMCRKFVVNLERGMHEAMSKYQERMLVSQGLVLEDTTKKPEMIDRVLSMYSLSAYNRSCAKAIGDVDCGSRLSAEDLLKTDWDDIPNEMLPSPSEMQKVFRAAMLQELEFDKGYWTRYMGMEARIPVSFFFNGEMSMLHHSYSMEWGVG